MKKIFAMILAIMLLSINIFAVTNENNWYFSSKSDNKRSILPKVDETKAFGIGPDEKKVYLTFDAGYENGNVAKTVEILKNNDVNGAFFVLKNIICTNTDLIKQMKENGNLVCNHTCSHKNICNLSKDELKNEIISLEECYKEKTGYELDKFFRPPEGKYNEESINNVADLGYKTVFWSLAYADWDNNNQKTREYALNKLNSRVHNGAVILLHPTSQTNVEILDEFIKGLKAQGYEFGCLNDI